MAVDLDRARTFLSQRGWLAQQPEEFRWELLRRTALKSFERGEIIYRYQDAPGMMFGIVEGAVLIGVPHHLVGRYYAHLGRPGDWYGEAAALHGVNRRVSAEANGAVCILSLSIQAVQELLQKQPLWLRNLSSLLLWNQETAIRMATDLLIRDARARVSARLLTLCGMRAGQELPKGPIELPLTQDQFAAMCGLSRKSAHRVLNRMEAEGLCENRYGEIVVKSPEVLAKRLMTYGARRE